MLETLLTKRAGVLVVLCVLMGGCANFRVEPAGGPEASGLHFFLPKPYVLFWWERTVTVKSGQVMASVVPRYQIIYLPDRSERYTVQQNVFFAKGDFKYTLRDGWCLDAVNADLDTTEFLRLLTETGTKAIEKAFAQGAAPPIPESEELPPPVLFELVWTDTTGTHTFRPVPLPGISTPKRSGPGTAGAASARK